MRARNALIGESYTDALACLGTPAEKIAGDGSVIATWTHTAPSAGASIPLTTLALLPITLPASLAGQIQLSGAASCNLVVHVVDGRVATARFNGASGGLSGPNEACAPIVRGCRDVADGVQ